MPVPAKTWIAIIGASLGAFMAVLNTYVVNASMSQIQGALGADANSGGKISTAYLVAEIVVIPLTGWLSRVFSLRFYLIANAGLFLVFSVACAFAQDLEQMIVLRALQGFSGGVLIPVAFTLIITLLPPSRQPTGIALFALAGSFAPAIGPVLGGWLTLAWGWQAVFLLNLAPGAVMLAMLWVSLERQPPQLGLLRQGDWIGIAAMALGLSTLQVMLEEGSKEDWFDSSFIVQLAALAVVSLTLFIWIELRSPRPLINLRLLLRRNFAAGASASFLVGVGLYGSVFILPIYLARVQGYNPGQIGMVLVWSALPQLVLIPLVPSLMRRVDPRWLVGIGIGLLAASSFMNVGLDANTAAEQFLWPSIVRALGVALVVTPLNTLAVAGIEVADASSASALLNVVRNLGGAIGIAGLQILLTQRQQFHAETLKELISLFDETTRQRLAQLAKYFESTGVSDPAVAAQKAILAIAERVQQQASIMAFGDTFYALGAVVAAALLAALLMRNTASTAALQH